VDHALVDTNGRELMRSASSPSVTAFPVARRRSSLSGGSSRSVPPTSWPASTDLEPPTSRPRRPVTARTP